MSWFLWILVFPFSDWSPLMVISSQHTTIEFGELVKLKGFQTFFSSSIRVESLSWRWETGVSGFIHQQLLGLQDPFRTSWKILGPQGTKCKNHGCGHQFHLGMGKWVLRDWSLSASAWLVKVSVQNKPLDLQIPCSPPRVPASVRPCPSAPSGWAPPPVIARYLACWIASYIRCISIPPHSK